MIETDWSRNMNLIIGKRIYAEKFGLKCGLKSDSALTDGAVKFQVPYIAVTHKESPPGMLFEGAVQSQSLLFSGKNLVSDRRVRYCWYHYRSHLESEDSQQALLLEEFPLTKGSAV